MSIPEFVPFNKIPRLNREVVVTEKIDGTNATILITEDLQILAGSRSKWLQVGKATDNYGFALWCADNRDDLLKLGVGTHRGEWYGQSINRNYGLDHRRFALFNSSIDPALVPNCCEVVPVLWKGFFEYMRPKEIVDELLENGSCAVHGFMNPEVIVIFHTATNSYFKKTCVKDEHWKGPK